MFIRKLKNRSGSISVQIISNESQKYKVVKTIGSSKTEEAINLLIYQAKHELKKKLQQTSLFVSQEDAQIESFLKTLKNSNVQIIRPELIFGRIYDSIGFNQVKEDMFRHLVIARLVFTLSKLKTVDYLFCYQGINVTISTIYRFL